MARVGHTVVQYINNHEHHSDGCATGPKGSVTFFVVPFCFVSLRRSRAAGIMDLEQKITGHRTGFVLYYVERRCLLPWIFRFFVSFHDFILHCVRVFGEEAGKTWRKGEFRGRSIERRWFSKHVK